MAQRVIDKESPFPAAPTTAEKLRELLLFSVSEDYSASRRALGADIVCLAARRPGAAHEPASAWHLNGELDYG